MPSWEDPPASLYSKHSISRRDFVMKSLATGFALAVLPVSAQTITTDTVGLDADEVAIPVNDGHIPAYRAQPIGRTHLPIVLVVQEVFGVHEHIKDLCRRLAKDGYLAIAPELFAREGSPTEEANIPALLANVVSRVPDGQVMSDLDATVDWAQGNNGDIDRVAVTGFCWGGRIAWLYAAHDPKLKAAVAWYGHLTGPSTALTPKNPVDIVGELKAPVLGLYGGKDAGIPAADIERMRQLLSHARVAAAASKIIVYPDAGHGFNADYRPSYVARDAQQAWKKMLQWFAQHGVA